MFARAFFRGALVAALAALQAPPSSAQSAPYPPSPRITKVSFDWSTHKRLAPGSDNWPVTWAEDGHQYTSWGDGGGFGGTNSSGRVSLGFARIEGGAADHRGLNVWGGKDPEHPATFGGKSYGILCVGGDLYAWVGPGSGTASYTEARLYRSRDHGATWTGASWTFVKSDGLIMPAILNFGRNYAGAPDGFVYHYFIHLQGNPSALAVHTPGRIDLARAPKDRLMDRSAYEFFSGLDDKGQPAWTGNPSGRRPVFQDPAGVGWNVSVSYNAGLGRYLLCTEHTRTFQGRLGMFDAPEPWGPWTTVWYASGGGDLFGAGRIETSTFFWNFSNKWLSADGKDFVLLFTGIGSNDSFNTVQGSFSASEEPESAGPFLRGDCDGDGTAGGTVTDAIVLLSFNFLGGAEPPCLAACDANGDGEVAGQVTDAVYVLQFGFLGGPPPASPFPGCGVSVLAGDVALGCRIPHASCAHP